MNDYDLAAKLTEKEVSTIVNHWGADSSDTKLFESLVRLGDSRALAMASTLNAKFRDVANVEVYTLAYCS